MKKIMYNKHIVRIFSSFMLCVLVLSSSLPVYASSDDTVSETNIDEIISKYANSIKNETLDFFNTYNIEVDNIDDLWDGFIATWKITEAVGYYGASSAALIANCLKDFIKYLRDNYFYGYFDGNEEIHYISPEGRLPSHNRPSGHSTTSHVTPNNSGYVGTLDDYHGSFPVQNGDDENYYFKKCYLSQSPTGSMFDGINVTYNVGLVVPNFYILSRTYWYSTNDIITPDLSNITLNEGQFIINYYSSLARSNSTGMSYFAVVHIDGDYLVVDSISNVNNNHTYNTFRQKYERSNEQPIGDIEKSSSSSYAASSYPQTPFHIGNLIFYTEFFGDGIFYLNSTHCYFYRNGLLYNLCDNNDTITFQVGSRYYLGGRDLNTTYIDNSINNYNTVINNVINEYPGITPDLLLNILNDYLNNIINGVDLSEYIEMLADRISELENDMQDIHNVLIKIKNYCKNIDITLTELFNRIDSLFTNTDAFALSVQLDNLFHHLEQTINNLPIPSGSGGNTTNFNFGDLDLHISAIFNMNDSQKTEINNQINQIAQPFSWINSIVTNSKSLIGSMVSRSAAYAGSSYDSSKFQGGIAPLDITVSGNTPVSDSSGGSSPGTIIYSPVEPPKLMMHLGNSNSSINYGGDVSVIDFSWYAPYKNTVDNFIVAFCWAVFIWHLFRSLPGIISGQSGSAGKDEE